MNKKKVKLNHKNEKKQNTKRKKSIIIFLIAALIFSGLAIYGIIRLNFILKEEIVITPERHIKTFIAENGQIINPEIKIDLFNQPSCTATCTETIQDLSNSKIIYNNTFTFSKKEKISTSIFYEINEFGTGTKVLSYKIECLNQKTNRCPASDNKYTGRMAILIEYSPTQIEKEYIDKFRTYYEQSSLNLKKSEAYNYEANKTLMLLKKTNTFNSKKEFEELNNMTITLQEEHKKSSSLIEQKNYEIIKNFVEESSIRTESEIILEMHAEKFKTLSDNINRHKIITEITNSMLDNIQIINSAYLFTIQNQVDDSNITNIETLNSEINLLLSSIEYKYFDSYHEIEQKINLSNTKIVELTNNTILNYEKTAYVNIATTLANNLVCASQGNNDCEETSSQTIIEKSLIDTYNKEKIVSLSSSDCLNAIESLNEITNLQTINITLDDESNLERKKIAVSMLKKEKRILTQKNITEKYLFEFIDGLMKQISSNYFNITEISENYYPEQNNKNLTSNMNPGEESIIILLNQIKNNCKTTIIKPFTTKVFYDNITITEEFINNIQPDFIPEIKSECCIYGECTECGIKPLRNPVIMLHGHSFSTSTTAFTSSEIFGPFEEKLFSDNLYIPLGYVRSFQSIESYKTLAQLRVPITLRPTYYTEFYYNASNPFTEERKIDSIDTYAIRLKDIIDKTKEATGSEQVTIIAHSMGGLVTRRYLQIFGEDSVDKIIMIGTPNKGIDSEIKSFCKLLGQRVECEEMAEDSSFMKKVNSQVTTNKVKIYNIIGYGCDGIDEEWDGITIKRNAELDGVETFYFNGTCEGTKIMHNRMLRPNEYPEIYEKVKQILLE